MLLEDEDEDDGRTDVMLTHLRRSRLPRQRAAAVIAGTFQTRTRSNGSIRSCSIDRLGDLGVPVLAGANLGHGGHVQTYPIGVRARLDADARTLSLLEAPLEP